MRFGLNCSLEKWADCVTRPFSLWNAEQLNSHCAVLRNLHGLGLHSLYSTWQSGWSTQQRLGFESVRGWGWPWNCGLQAHNPKPHQRGNLSPVATQLPSLTRLFFYTWWQTYSNSHPVGSWAFCWVHVLAELYCYGCGPNCSTKSQQNSGI